MTPPDSRGWFSAGLFALTAAVLALLAWNPRLADNHLFATLAQAVVITGLINLAAGYEFGAAKPPQKTPERPTPEPSDRSPPAQSSIRNERPDP
ncbi:MAG TPA: hypothetical protein VME40_03730 [Caulobacteraceae bacterium]|nr:hypothetical protein [Caulobacteraceae bacterium]